MHFKNSGWRGMCLLLNAIQNRNLLVVTLNMTAMRVSLLKIHMFIKWGKKTLPRVHTCLIWVIYFFVSDPLVSRWGFFFPWTGRRMRCDMVASKLWNHDVPVLPSSHHETKGSKRKTHNVASQHSSFTLLLNSLGLYLLLWNGRSARDSSLFTCLRKSTLPCPKTWNSWPSLCSNFMTMFRFFFLFFKKT